MVIIASEQAMQEFGENIGRRLVGGEIIELVGDIGAGKTTFTKGLAKGLGVSSVVQSPTFTVSQVYEAHNGLFLHHYDFYRLEQSGIMADELREVMNDKSAITVMEWSDVVKSTLPKDYLQINFMALSETERHLEILAHGELSRKLLEKL